MGSSWYLESRLDARGRVRRSAVRPLPFRIGRRVDSDLFLDSSHGSGRHAELFERNGKLWVQDLDSTNGTSLNGRRLSVAEPLSDGDILHFADCEFLVSELPPDSSLKTTKVFSLAEQERLAAQVRAPAAFRKMLHERSFRADFQPVVRLADRELRGYEILGRGTLGGIETSPTELFYIAEQIGDEVLLSEAFRARGLELAEELRRKAAPLPLLFMNTHPTELADPMALLASIRDLRRAHPDLDLVLELHEAAVAELSSLRTLRAGLEELDIGIAFDDFGTGQARLLELTEVSPQFLKFDAPWIDGLHEASDKRRDMVASLLKMVDELGIVAVAECVESQEDADACLELGFDLAQGHYFGSPVSSDDLPAI